MVCVAYGTQIAWFGLGNAPVAMSEDSRISAPSCWIFSAALIVLSWNDSRGSGPTEYLTVTEASLRVFGAVVIVVFLTKTDVVRGFLLISLPLGVLVLLTVCWLRRQWLIVMRERGNCSVRVLLVGSVESVAQIARTSSTGYLVVGACTPRGAIGDTVPGTDIAITGSVNDIEHALQLMDADTVAVTSTDELTPDKMKQISWNLQASPQHLVPAPSIMNLAGPHLHTHPVAGLPLIHVETPRFSRGQLFLKRAVDLTAMNIVVVLSPVLAFLAASVRLSSEGPVVFRQKRVARGGREFTMLKFHSMVINAEELLENMQRQRREQGIDSGNDVLFKMKNDPRVTRIGRVMRKYSLDELPQLSNLLG